MSEINNKKLIIVISSPSGAGKTSVCKKLIERDPNICLSISDTTRYPRDNEKDGVDYNFIKEDDFKERIKDGLYVEYANVFGNFYGSKRQNIIDIFERHKDVLFDIDWQGAEQLRNSSFSNIISIFIIPPSKDAIYQRLKSRAEISGDNESAINNRMQKYETEMSHQEDYDHVVINEVLQDCITEIEKIINNQRKNLIN